MGEWGHHDEETSTRYSPEVRERAVRMVREHQASTRRSGRRSRRWRQDRLHGGDAAQVGAAGRARPGAAAGLTTRRARADQGAGTREPGAATRQRDPAQGVRVFCPGGARPPRWSDGRVHRRSSRRYGVEPICRVLPIAPSTELSRCPDASAAPTLGQRDNTEYGANSNIRTPATICQSTSVFLPSAGRTRRASSTDLPIGRRWQTAIRSDRLGGGVVAAKLKTLTDRAASDRANVVTGDPEIVEFALRKAARLVDGFAITPPIAVRAGDVHLTVLYDDPIGSFQSIEAVRFVCPASLSDKLGDPIRFC